MASENYSRFADGIVDMLAPLGAVAHRRFFGGRGFVCGDVQFAMIIEGLLYLRVDADLAARMRARGAEPFVYGTRRREVEVFSYYSVPEEILDDADTLLGWARQSLAIARQNWKPRRRASPAKKAAVRTQRVRSRPAP